MDHDFTLVYALSPEPDSQDEVLQRLAGSDCANATVGWGGLGTSPWLSVGRRRIAMRRSRLLRPRWHRCCPGRN